MDGLLLLYVRKSHDLAHPFCFLLHSLLIRRTHELGTDVRVFMLTFFNRLRRLLFLSLFLLLP